MSKKIWIGIIVVVIALLLWWIFASNQATAPTETTGGETTYSQELDGLNEVDLNAEFQAADADLNTL